ncbi:MAG: hypothetical protein HPY83_09440 [Anaerolineae bacterium]|nr:hypothetical protein [Anaerolineae bacterium]
MPHHEQPQHGLPRHGETTGTSDVTYGLTSVLYHALQGAETYAAYVEDAERLGDQEAARFFQEAQQEETRRADRAKALLRTRIG